MPALDLVVHDERFGRVHVTGDGGRITVSGEQVPGCEVTRTSPEPARADVPIGTREGAELTAALSGRPGTLTPGPGRLTRGSYRVDAEFDGDQYRLPPVTATASRLSVNGTAVGELDTQPLHATWQDAVRAEHAAVGYLLLAAFGAGARRMPGLLLESLTQYQG
ncbi:hypothetical protein GCM10010174_37530 [Kutzneria viridogrisea]|uniref:Uncharacterized protein n=1 Tax=Kutzneria viridogrisea TaxID=47990 RepID=A0ABR6BTX0_9PSEU|nr:hypothetical protein [Kutzneria viridogrisea]